MSPSLHFAFRAVQDREARPGAWPSGMWQGILAVAVFAAIQISQRMSDSGELSDAGMCDPERGARERTQQPAVTGLLHSLHGRPSTIGAFHRLNPLSVDSEVRR